MAHSYMVVANNYRDQLRPHISDADQSVLNDIQFVVFPSYGLNAFALREGGVRKVGVTLGYIRVAYELSVGYAASMDHGAPQCFEGFIQEIARGILDNNARANRGEPLVGLPSFGAFFPQHQDSCHAMTAADINKPDVLRYVSSEMNCIMEYVIGHEIAHHVLGHVGSPVASAEASRKIEAAADAQSVQWAFDIGVNPLPAFPVLVLYSMIGVNDLAGEAQSDHPASSRRYADFLDAIAAKERDTDWYAKKFKKPPTKEMLDGIEEMRASARRIVPN